MVIKFKRDLKPVKKTDNLTKQKIIRVKKHTAEGNSWGCNDTCLDDSILLPGKGVFQHPKLFKKSGPRLHESITQQTRRNIKRRYDTSGEIKFADDEVENNAQNKTRPHCPKRYLVMPFRHRSVLKRIFNHNFFIITIITITITTTITVSPPHVGLAFDRWFCYDVTVYLYKWESPRRCEDLKSNYNTGENERYCLSVKVLQGGNDNIISGVDKYEGD